MTRLYFAAPAARAARALVGIGAAFVLVVVASGCVGSQAPSPTPDPFAGLSDRSDQAFRQGLEAYGQGQYRDALTSFESARTLSPTDDARIVQMIDRSKAALAPTPTPVPPKPTEVPAVPTATPVLLSTLTPDTELGSRYFGQVTLSMVPGRDADAVAATQFFYQDQIGLHIDGLKQHLRLPFTMRVFNTDSSRLVAEIQSEDNANAVPTKVATPVNASALTSAAAATPTTQDIQLARFWDTYVWYHKGGEDPGRYRLELYANGILTNSFDYTVGSVPVASPEPTLAAVLDPTPALPNVQTTDLAPPPPVPAVPSTRPSQSGSAPVAVSAAPTAQPTPIPAPTPVPTPQTAYTTSIGGIPAGLDIDWNQGRFFLADASGVISSTDSPTGQQRPTLGVPINLSAWGAGLPVDLATESTTGRLFVSARRCPRDPQTQVSPPGCIIAVDGNSRTFIKSIALEAAPGDLRVDADLGLLYVAIPERQALAIFSTHSGDFLGYIYDMPQVTSLALDLQRHTLYAAHLGGQVTVIDVPARSVTARISLTGAGLTSIATARGLAYAVNTATHELAVVEPNSQLVNVFQLSQEPAAVAAAEDTGAVYVLTSRSDFILRIDPMDGSELDKVVISNRSGHASIQPNDVQSLRPRLVINPTDDTLFATLPEAGSLAAVRESSFPVLARTIPFPDISDNVVATSIPDVLRPGGVYSDRIDALGR